MSRTSTFVRRAQESRSGQRLMRVVSVVGLLVLLGAVAPAGHASAMTVSDDTGQIASVATTGSTAGTPTVSPVATGTITIETFGYKFGRPPKGCKFIANVRNVKAGPFSPRQNGLMPSVRKRVMATKAAKRWHQVFLTQWLPNLTGGDKVAIGCARGHHRSVALAWVFEQDLKARGFTVNLINRDIKKKY